MSPWEKRLAQDRKEIRAEERGLRAAAIARRMPELVARLEGKCQRVIDARHKPGQTRRKKYFPDLLHAFVASQDAVWGIIPGDIDDANSFRVALGNTIRREKAAAHIRRKGAFIYLERIG